MIMLRSPLWKRLLLHAYLYGSLPYRALANACARRSGRAPVIVLFYHRVADDHANAWTMPSDAFVRQVRWLQARFQLVSLPEAQRRIRAAANKQPVVSITFDDGYADNCQRALPWLISQRVPCTYFVSVRQVLEGAPFPHDVSAGRPLAPNTLEQLQGLAASGVEIGVHTRTHANLGEIRDRRILRDEVVVAGQDLQAALGRPVRYFAFPFGLPEHLSADAFVLAREARYEGVCSAYGGYNFPGDDDFHLQRIHGGGELVRFKNWLTIDPRRVSRARLLQYYRMDAASRRR
jgi:peptidoglycan/xylan/chitin deacetylase (PgdA/CDA1 family)